MGGRTWNEKDIEILKENQDAPAKEVQKLMPHRSIHSIYNQKRQLGLSKNNKFSEEDIEFIRNNYNDMTTFKIGEVLGVHRVTVERQLKRMGLVPLTRLDTWQVTDHEVEIQNGEYSFAFTFEKTEEDYY